MTSDELQTIVSQMITTIKNDVGPKWSDIETFVKNETQVFAESLKDYAQQHLEGKITEADAIESAQDSKEAMQTVLFAAEGVALILTERSINTAIDAIKNLVNDVIGFNIL